MSDTKLRVGYIGLGIMGRPMAINCLKAGYEVTVFNRTAEKTKPLAEAGAAVAASPAEVAGASDIVLMCVSASDDVLSVALDEHSGVIAGVAAGAIVVDHSTVAPTVAGRCAKAFAAKGVGFLDAPISGGDTGAIAGTLSIMVGGDEAHFDRALPVLEAMGKTITHCGDSGAGYVAKLCNQICSGLHLVAAAEAVSLAVSVGVDPHKMLQAIRSGAAGSWMLDNLAGKMIDGDYKPGFFVDYQLKDLRLASAVAQEINLPLPGTALAEELFCSATALGHGRDGTAAIYEVARTLAGQANPNS